jgi:hypothetical protein
MEAWVMPVSDDKKNVAGGVKKNKVWVIRCLNGAGEGPTYVYWNPNEGWVYDTNLALVYDGPADAMAAVEHYTSLGLWLKEKVEPVQIFVRA